MLDFSVMTKAKKVHVDGQVCLRLHGPFLENKQFPCLG